MEFHGPSIQIFLQNSAIDKTTVIYTVPVGKKLHLISGLLTTGGEAVGTVRASIRNATNVVQKDIGYIKVGITALVFPGCPFTPSWAPVLSAGWNLVVISDTALLEGTLNIFGLEVDE